MADLMIRKYKIIEKVDIKIKMSVLILVLMLVALKRRNESFCYMRIQ
jgi:hypothetical protein